MSTNQEDVNQGVRDAHALAAAGHLAEAEARCRGMIESHPRAAWPYALLGHLRLQAGDAAQARGLLEHAVALDGSLAQAWFTLAQARLALGLSAEADAAFAQAMRGGPAWVDARYALGRQAMETGQAELAATHFRACAQARPQQVGAWVNLGLSLLQCARHPEAYAAMQRAAALRPRDAEIAGYIADILEDGAAEPEDQLEAHAMVATLAPDNLGRQMRYAAALVKGNRYAEAKRIVDAVVRRDPSHLLARWVSFQIPDSSVFPDEAARERFVTQWRDGIAEFDREMTTAPQRDAQARSVLGSLTNFHLTYLGLPLVAEQRHHALTVRRLVEAAIPGMPEVPARQLGEGRRRVGVISPFLYQHSVSTVMAGAFFDLPREQFELHMFYPNNVADAVNAQWRERADVFVTDLAGAAAWAEAIRAAELDVLVYLDLGMHPVMQTLSAWRLAPVQVAMWGHPITTGAPNIDYYVSSAAMEPENAAEHYTEQLIRLPGLGGRFLRTQAPAATPGTAAAARIGCMQSLPKLNPPHDRLFARVLATAPAATLDLYNGGQAADIALLAARMRPVFVAEGVDFDARVRLHSKLSPSDFAAAQAGLDIVLDTLEFSGCISSLLTLSQGVPLVTLPGPLMRGRQSAAMLRLLDLDELVARDTDDYVAIAARLANEPAWRADVAARLRDRGHRLFEDAGATAALAGFLSTVQPPPSRTRV